MKNKITMVLKTQIFEQTNFYTMICIKIYNTILDIIITIIIILVTFFWRKHCRTVGYSIISILVVPICISVWLV